MVRVYPKDGRADVVTPSAEVPMLPPHTYANVLSQLVPKEKLPNELQNFYKSSAERKKREGCGWMRLWQTVLVTGTVTHSMLLNLWLDFSQREGALRKEEERKEEERKEEERKEEERRVTEHVGVPMEPLDGLV
jgi:hypothetical protein